MQSFLKRRGRGPNRCICGVEINDNSQSCRRTMCRKQIVSRLSLPCPAKLMDPVAVLKQFKSYAAAARAVGVSETTFRNRIVATPFYNQLMPQKARTKRIPHEKLVSMTAEHGKRKTARLLGIDRRTLQRRLQDGVREKVYVKQWLAWRHYTGKHYYVARHGDIEFRIVRADGHYYLVQDGEAVDAAEKMMVLKEKANGIINKKETGVGLQPEPAQSLGGGLW